MIPGAGPALTEARRLCDRLSYAASPAAGVNARICRRRRAPSFPARGFEPQDDLDDRALPDRLRSLHRHLDWH